MRTKEILRYAKKYNWYLANTEKEINDCNKLAELGYLTKNTNQIVGTRIHYITEKGIEYLANQVQ